jgi:hypothetical protein
LDANEVSADEETISDLQRHYNIIVGGSDGATRMVSSDFGASDGH